MSRILHSTNACIDIVNHTGDEMRNLLLKKIVDSKSKISLIIDESSTLSKKSTLTVFVQEFNLAEPIDVFTDDRIRLCYSQWNIHCSDFTS
jgi:hypothetical protein